MLVNILLGVFGVVLFLFIFWKRLKDDYSSDIIFQISTLILIGLGVGIGVSKLFIPLWFFWIGLVTSLIASLIAITKFKLRYYETIEALILSLMPLVSLMFFRDSITNSSLNSFLAFVLSLILIFVAYWFDLKYKGFSWYRSGKIGFAGLMSGFIFFSIRTVIDILQITMVSFVGKIDLYLSAGLGITCLILLINLGRVKE